LITGLFHHKYRDHRLVDPELSYNVIKRIREETLVEPSVAILSILNCVDKHKIRKEYFFTSSSNFHNSKKMAKALRFIKIEIGGLINGMGISCIRGDIRDWIYIIP